MRMHISSFIFFWCCYTLTVAAYFQCASLRKCKCHVLKSQEISADCSGLGLTTLPRFSSRVVRINLSRNNFSVFPSLTYLPKNVLRLDFSYNNISKFNNSSVFQKVSRLKELSLQGNKLKLDNATYPKGLFRSLAHLQILNLKDNVKYPAKGYYPGETIVDLKSLESLLIDGLSKGKFGPEFLELRLLNTLDLSGETGKCYIYYLDSSYFVNLPNLQLINVSHCHLFRIQNGTFGKLSSLKKLDISHNEDLTFRVLTNVTYDLQFTDIKVLRANQVHRTFGSGTTIFIEDIKYLNNTKVEEIHLDLNRLELFQNDALKYIPKTLKKVSAAENRFTMGFYVLEIYFLNGVKEFNGNSQYRSHDPRDIFDSLNTRSCDQPFRKPCPMTDGNHMENLRTLTERVDIAEFFKQMRPGITIPILLPKNLQRISFSDSGLQYEIPRMKFSDNRVKYIDFSKNVLNNWIGPIENIDMLEYVDLSNNYCSHISDSFFKYARNLKVLNANNNLLGFILNTDNGGIFQDLQNLTRLDISQNRIQILQPDVFMGLLSLQRLDISNNLLRDWTFEIKHMKNLRFIDFSGNQLNYIPASARDSLDSIQQIGNLTLDLSGNSLVCTCETIDFLRWMKNTNIHFRKWKHYKCTPSNGTKLSLQNLENIILGLSVNCMSKIGLIVGSLAAILFSITVLLCGIIYRYRWKIRYLYYMTKNKFRGYSPVSTNESEDCFEYDAFISYADEDRSFVVKDMLKNLETDRSLRICIHHRDFIPGIDIAANITKSINKSRKTIVILSSSFLKSYWCQFEFNMARMESIYSRDGRGVLFLVFYRNISARDLPLMMMELIESQSYIEYPNDPQGDIVFWDKVAEAIKK